MNRLVELAEKELVREEILEICRQSIPLGADEKVLLAALRRCGHRLTVQQVTEQLYYLQGKRLVELQEVNNRALGISRVIARVTPEGIDMLEGNPGASGGDTGGWNGCK